MSSQASQFSAEAIANAQNNANLNYMRVSGMASNAFQPRKSHGTTPLSLPPQGDFNSFAELKQHVQDHSKLAGWAIEEGKGSEIDKAIIESVQSASSWERLSRDLLVRRSERKSAGQPKALTVM